MIPKDGYIAQGVSDAEAEDLASRAQLEMEHFDQLPASVRAALELCTEAYSPSWAFNALANGSQTVESLLRILASKPKGPQARSALHGYAGGARSSPRARRFG